MNHRPTFLLTVILATSITIPTLILAEKKTPPESSAETPPQPPALKDKRDNYQNLLRQITTYQHQQAERFAHASESEKKAIVAATRTYLEKTLVQDIFPAWYGTDWNFHGTTTIPGQGTIACGYFVSTCLTHLGFKVDRIKLAQQASQLIIETFMPKDQRQILAGGQPMNAVKNYLRQKGDGIYIVGLDHHVGFIAVSGDQMNFIHSAYEEPESWVKSEKIDTPNPLSNSQYRVFGKIFSDDMITAWLTNKTFPVKTR